MTPERILIFELNWLGDILFSFPFLRAIRKRFPEAYIASVVVPRYVDLVINNPWVNEVHVLSDNNGLRSLKEKLEFINVIRREKYDTCFLLKPSRIKSIMAFYAGIGERIGFSGKKALLTKEVEMPGGNMHRADVILSLAGAAGVSEADGMYEFFLTEADEERADELLRDVRGGRNRAVGINPGGNWDAKRWPAENYTALIKKILDNFGDVEVMVTGAEKDMALAGHIVSEAGSGRCYTVAGRTDLSVLAALFKRCALVISADSGPLHLASATGVTTVGLFGPTSYKITGPRGRGKNIILSGKVDCAVPCYEETCGKDFICMKSITVDEVFKAAQKELRRND
ncbi:MAG: glycosyltransferase family 9 protein [Candidatus Omnitrophota bacterium]